MERSLNTAWVKSRGLRGSLCSGRVHVGKLPYRAVSVTVDSMAADAQASIHPLAMPEQSRIRRDRGADRLDVAHRGRQVEYRIGGARLVGPLPHHQAHPHDQPDHQDDHHRRNRLRVAQSQSPSCSRATAARTGGRRRTPSPSPASTAPAPIMRTRASLSDGRGPAPSPCWTSTCTLPAPSWLRCSHR